MPSYANIHRSSHSWMLNHVWCLAPGPGPHSSCQLPRVMARLARQVDVSAIQIYHDQVPWRAGHFLARWERKFNDQIRGCLVGVIPTCFLSYFIQVFFPGKNMTKWVGSMGTQVIQVIDPMQKTMPTQGGRPATSRRAAPWLSGYWWLLRQLWGYFLLSFWPNEWEQKWEYRPYMTILDIFCWGSLESKVHIDALL